MNSNNVVLRGNTAQQWRLGLFQDSDFAGDLENQKSTSGGVLVHFRKSHVRTNTLDVLETDFNFKQFNSIRNYFLGYQARGDLCTNQREVRSVPYTLQKRKTSHGMIDDSDNVDCVLSNVNSSRQRGWIRRNTKIGASLGCEGLLSLKWLQCGNHDRIFIP